LKKVKIEYLTPFFHSVLNENQQKLFETYPAKERKVVDSAKAFMAL